MDPDSNRLLRYWPSLSAIALLGAATATILLLSLRMNRGHFGYALDDTYILMAMAKNLARHGVWGVSPYQFTPNSSSPLWTSLLGILFLLFGVHTATPLILNLLAAVALIFTVQMILESLAPRLPRLYTFIVLLCVLFMAPVARPDKQWPVLERYATLIRNFT